MRRRFCTLRQVHAGLSNLQRAIDKQVVWHTDVKEAILLGLVSREHVYIEGPPGIAKTKLSEVVAVSTGLSHWFHQLHRDTRMSELVGESVVVRDCSTAQQVIRHSHERGGILTCEIAVLDDLGKAPGEALNVLLRVLNERKFGSHEHTEDDKLPLLSAIATGAPAHKQGRAMQTAGEALDPATIDRFTLQVRASGLLHGGGVEFC